MRRDVHEALAGYHRVLDSIDGEIIRLVARRAYYEERIVTLKAQNPDGVRFDKEGVPRRDRDQEALRHAERLPGCDELEGVERRRIIAMAIRVCRGVLRRFVRRSEPRGTIAEVRA